jgi:hypothetical protein
LETGGAWPASPPGRITPIASAETVIEPLENPEEYRSSEAAIVAEYLPHIPVEQELVTGSKSGE